MKKTETSGCKAIDGCERKDTCLRHKIYKEHHTPYKGWAAHQMCALSEFAENKYLHYLKVENE